MPLIRLAKLESLDFRIFSFSWFCLVRLTSKELRGCSMAAL